MIRPKSFCPCCGVLVEWYADQFSVGHDYRCGNCFEPLDRAQLRALEQLQVKLQALDDQRTKLLQSVMMGGQHADAPTNR